MSTLKSVALAAAVAVALPLTALAADLPLPPAYVEFGGWYLRGDIGMTNQQFRRLENISFAGAPGFSFLDKGGFESGPLFGLGIGYQYNSWLRFDITGEYRGKVGFSALDRYTNPARTTFFTNDYRSTKSEWVFLANAYADLGTWYGVTPFVGAGVGFAMNRIDHFRDTNVIAGGGGWADGASKTNLAWALHAGLAYRVTPNFTVELAYRFLWLGDAQTGTLVNLDPTVPCATTCQPMHFRDIYSHDLKLGMRWALGGGDYGSPPIRKY
ncbi:MAG TPA: outer membrane beta-barrel protein [Xanthobacteraceae bacterium]|nr:outer membrane beta-barrel protein [Xanthobacteraceae bacterium]